MQDGIIRTARIIGGNAMSPVPASAVDTSNFVVQRDGTFVVQRDNTQVVDQRP